MPIVLASNAVLTAEALVFKIDYVETMIEWRVFVYFSSSLLAVRSTIFNL